MMETFHSVIFHKAYAKDDKGLKNEAVAFIICEDYVIFPHKLTKHSLGRYGSLSSEVTFLQRLSGLGERCYDF
jgi:hypothetical protein